MKAYYPLEFAAATMNHTKNEEAGLKVLRDFVENDGIEYIDVDPDESMLGWTIKNGKLLGGLVNIIGIAEKQARSIIKARKTGAPLTKAQYTKLISASTPYEILYPANHWWGDYYERPEVYSLPRVSKISEVNEPGEYIILGIARQKDLRDMNEYNELVKRNGQVLEEHDKYLRIVIEDDTGQILCKIDRFKYLELDGPMWADRIVSGKSWLIVRAEMRSGGWRILNIRAIADLEDIEYHGKNNIVLERSKRKHEVLVSRVS